MTEKCPQSSSWDMTDQPMPRTHSDGRCDRPRFSTAHSGSWRSTRLRPWTGNPAVMEQDAVMLRQAQQAAEDAVSKAASELGETERPEVTVTVMNGFAAQELLSSRLGWLNGIRMATVAPPQPAPALASCRPAEAFPAGAVPNSIKASSRPAVNSHALPSRFSRTVRMRVWSAIAQAALWVLVPEVGQAFLMAQFTMSTMSSMFQVKMGATAP
jgi:hypothetical protein